MRKKKFCFYLLLVFACISCVSSYAQQNSVFHNDIVQPRMRVIIDNDFGGDPDGLFQLAHELLSPSVEVRAIIGSHLKAGDGFDPSATQAENAAKKATEVVKLLHMEDRVPVIAGSNTAMPNDSTPVKSEAVNFIIKEALRTDVNTPLYVVCGAGLTEIASAVLTNPAIAGKITLIWIGGPEYDGLAYPPPNYSTPEYNLAIDIAAVKVIFNKSAIKLWQVPRNAYRQAILPYSVLLLKIKTQGALGNYLAANLENVMRLLAKYNLNIGEVYILGDSPLVLLTALQSSFEADPSSSKYAVKTAPVVTSEGTYAYNANGRNIRVYDALDINLMFSDFFAKLELYNK